MLRTRVGLLVVSATTALLAMGGTGAASTRPYCHYPDNYNTILCSRTTKQAEEYCTNAAEYSAPNSPTTKVSGRLRGGTPGVVVAHYEGGSAHRYLVSFYVSGIEGCKITGQRTVSYMQERKDGPAGAYHANSSQMSKTTALSYNVRQTLNAPYDCAVLPAGSSVRVAVRISWKRAKGWGTGTAVRTFHTKAQPIC
jgi:hypothetical protein